MSAPIIYFNNSSLEDLPCGRRYLLRNIKGAKVPRDPKLTLGTIFHKFAEIIAPEDNVFTLTMMKKPNINYGETSSPTINHLANLACKSRDQGHTRAESAREYFFSLDETHLLEPEFRDKVTLLRVGTMDQVYYNPSTDTVDIPDYKTTSSVIDAKFLSNYAVKTQKFFYVDALQQVALREPEKFPLKNSAAALIAAQEGRIRWQYIFVQLTTGNILAQPPNYLHQDELAAFRERLSERRNLAAFYHLNPQLADNKDGAFFNHCYFCPFRNEICSLNDPEKEKDAAAKWRYGFAPYDPQHKDE